MIEISDLFGQSAWAATITFFRVSAVFFVLPGLGETFISSRVRIVLAILMTLAISPAVAPHMPVVPASIPWLAWALLTETISGLFLGIGLRLFIMAIQTAGSIASQSTSLAQLMGQNGLDPLPAIGHILSFGALALLMVTGYHVKAAAFLILSYEILPPLQLPSASSIAMSGSVSVSKSFALAFTLAAPFVILSVLYNLALGAINKAMPQLMVAFVGAPVITFGSIAMLLVSAPVLLSVWLIAVEQFLAAPYK